MGNRPLKMVCSLLDALLVDRKQRPIGCIDGILLELDCGRPPRVAALVVGPAVALRRIHPRAARVARALARRWFGASLRAACIPLEQVRDIGVDVEVDIDAESDPRFLRTEKWLRRHLIRRLPGGTS